MTRKKLPVGIESFEEFLKEDFYYVDKTMFLSELLQNWGKVNLFTRPRRFGKSLNMSMLKAFLETGSDASLFDGLKISQQKDLCDQYMGKFPVLFITLKGVDGLLFQDACAAMKGIIGREALRFRYLADSQRLSDEEHAMYRQLTEVGNARDAVFTMTDHVLVESIHTLTQLLSKHHGRKVVVLVDEYDVPLDRAFQAGYYHEMVALLRGLFGNAFKTNEYLYFAVLTGCLRISKESIFTGLNNLKIHTITDARYDEYFGFTEEEVAGLLDFYGLTDHMETVREWYDGYRFGKENVYCPWDVINYCDALLEDPEAEPENYWANTSGNSLIKRFVAKASKGTRDEMELLIAGTAIDKDIKQELTYDELENSIENIWSVLFSTGYLTWKERIAGNKYRLTIPNREIRALFISQIQEWFQETTRADASKLELLCGAFIEGNTMEIEEILNGYLWNSISIRDTAVRKQRKENFYHGMLLGLLQYESDWEITSNAESGEGYCDILIKTPDRTGVVVEIKYAPDGDLEKSCRDALCQIKSLRYDAVLTGEGIEKGILYGIAFYKKRCKVQAETISIL